MKPREFLALDNKEKAFIIAAIQIKIENDREKAKEAKRKRKSKIG